MSIHVVDDGVLMHIARLDDLFGATPCGLAWWQTDVLNDIIVRVCSRPTAPVEHEPTRCLLYPYAMSLMLTCLACIALEPIVMYQ